jgi:hypothetical protein
LPSPSNRFFPVSLTEASKKQHFIVDNTKQKVRYIPVAGKFMLCHLFALCISHPKRLTFPLQEAV